MLYLLWGLINLALIIGFLILCFKATTLVKNNIGKPAALLFAVGLISFGSRQNDNSQLTEVLDDQVRSEFIVRPDSLRKNTSGMLHIILKDNLVSKYMLSIDYGVKKPDNLNIPYHAYAGATGFTLGTEWKPERIEVKRTENNNRFQYSVYGHTQWKLLGLQLAEDSRVYDGFVQVK
jgi:hypothetical protein